MASPLELDPPNPVTEEPPRPPTIREPYWLEGDNDQSRPLPFGHETESHADPDTYVDKIIVSLKNAENHCLRAGNIEMIGLEWIVAETEIRQVLDSRLVPESDLQSAGLNPNDPAHFKSCLEKLEEEMMTRQRYDLALSHCQGMRKIFEGSNLQSLSGFLESSDLEILKMVFFRSWTLVK